MKIMTFLIGVLFLISSCADFNYDRLPASTSAITDNDVAKVFEFESSNVTGTEDYGQKLLKYIENNKIFQGTYISGNEIAVEFIEDASLPPKVAYYPQCRVDNNKYTINILHSKDAIYDQAATAELRDFLRKFRDEKYFLSHFAAFEMYYNAQEKDASALYNMAKIREARILDGNPYPEENHDEVVKELEARSKQWSEDKLQYQSFEKSALKIQKIKDGERRAVIDALDKATESQQFKTFVANNDRKGVSKLLKQYLPWEQMAPFENRYWQNYLNILENPLPMEDRIFVYRGIDDDFVYTANKAGAAIEKEEALKEGKVFFMSTIMTKNQGTWNRRLRSLTAMNEKFIGSDRQGNNEFTKSARIVSMFTNHSRKAEGSPFLSLTPKFNVARSFGSKKMSAYLLDPRAISFNFASKFANEVEFLVPLVVFPDEIAAFYDMNIHADKTNTEEMVKKMLEEKLVQAHGEAKGKAMYDKILNASAEYFDAALNRYNGKTTAIVPDKNPGIIAKIFSSLFSTKPTTVDVKVAPVGKSCMDLISQFWK